MVKYCIRALALIIAGAGLVGLAQTPAAAADRDCSDFATQAAAQAFMLASGAGDPHGLDGSDNDGRACESLPCPCGATQPPPPPSTGGGEPPNAVRRNVGNVVKVTDGDTLKVRIRGIGTRDIRIIGIDTPEVYGGEECGGPAASRKMKQLAPVGSSVTLISDPTQDLVDRYDRLLRYVERGGKDLGRAQVNLGMAKVYIYNNNPFQRTRNYQRVQASANANDRGSWGTCW